jgi:hypothetical protein
MTTIPTFILVALSLLAIPGVLMALFGLWAGTRLISIYWKDRHL